jgi:hypothetical protein
MAGNSQRPNSVSTWEGTTDLVDFVSTHFKVDLSEYWDGKLELFLT